MTNAEYHAHPALSNSGISLILDRPSKYYREVIQGEREETTAMAFGSAFHCAVLEPERFTTDYPVCPYDGRTKAGKEWREANADKTAISQKDMELIDLMRKGAGQNLTALDLIQTKGQVEHSYFWVDILTGTECKCRPDKIIDIAGDVTAIDVKTTTDASAAEFSKSVANFGYHRQQSFYTCGLLENGIDVNNFLFLVFEKSPPYECAVYQIDERSVLQGGIECNTGLEIYSSCIKNSCWPGLPAEITTVSLPAWYK